MALIFPLFKSLVRSSLYTAIGGGGGGPPAYYGIFDTSKVPGTKAQDGGAASYNLGTNFTTSKAGKVYGVRFYWAYSQSSVPAATTDVAVFAAATSNATSGAPLARKTGVVLPAADGWVDGLFDTPLDVPGGAGQYIACFYTPNAYAYDGSGNPITVNDLTTNNCCANDVPPNKTLDGTDTGFGGAVYMVTPLFLAS